MRKHSFLLSLFLLTLCASTDAKNIIQDYVPNAQSVGQGRLSVFVWNIYDATLYAPHGKWKQKAPYALEINYLKSLKGQDIADRSIEEIWAQGIRDEAKLTRWQTHMRMLFPDVYKGDTLTGVYTQKGTTIFYKNGKKLDTIKDPEFGRVFFGIWLSENTSEPDLRKQLLGQS